MGRDQNAPAEARKRQNGAGFTPYRPPAIPIAPLHSPARETSRRGGGTNTRPAAPPERPCRRGSCARHAGSIRESSAQITRTSRSFEKTCWQGWDSFEIENLVLGCLVEDSAPDLVRSLVLR